MKTALVLTLIFLTTQNSVAAKKRTLSPFQQSIQDCLGSSFEASSVDSSLKIYKSVEKNNSLLTSETLFREVEYSKKGHRNKLKFENGIIQIFKFDEEDDSLKLENSEKFGENKEHYKMRHEIRSVESRFAQLLFQADIKSDYQKIRETRAQGLVLDLEWSDAQIKSMQIQSDSGKKILKCYQKGQLDICNCRQL